MRLIDGDALQAEHIEAYGKRLLLIDTAPTIEQPEIIRCKECGHCHYDEEFDNYWCERTLSAMMVEKDGFCKWGRRPGAWMIL